MLGAGERGRRGTALRVALAAGVLAASVRLAAGVAGVEAGSGGSEDESCAPGSMVRCAEADYVMADLGAADFRGADLRAANFNGAFLHSTSLVGADLRDADLRATTLTAANLRQASLAGANLADANLSFATVTRTQLRDAYLCRTRLPDEELSRRDCADAGPRLAKAAHARVARRAAGRAPEPGFDANASPARGAPAAGRHKQRVPRARKARKGGKQALRVQVVGAGRVRANKGGLVCPGNCVVRYRKGTRVTLTATPAAGMDFSEWSGPCHANAAKCALWIRNQKRNQVTATFAVPGCQAPQGQDSDSDGVPDCTETEGWSLGVTTPRELSDNSGSVRRNVDSDPEVADTDGDGADDGDEFRLNSDPRSGDTDGDGLADREEIVNYRTLPNHADSDNDSLSPAGLARDPRLFDNNELVDLHSNPRVADTDGDSINDFVEVVEEHTNPRVPDLPTVSLVAVPGRSNPQLDLDYTVEETTGSEQESASSTEVANSQENSSEVSRETTNEHTFQYQVGGKCQATVLDTGCSVSQNFTNSWTNSVTQGSTSGFSNSQETSRTAEEVARTSAERKVTLEPTGCMQVVLRLENNGPVSVSVGNLQVLAFTENPVEPAESELLAALLPIEGQVVSSTCPATVPGFGPVELPPGGHADVAFGQVVNSRVLMNYMLDPTPLQYELGAISMKGTNLAGEEVDFLGEVASKVHDRAATVEVNFPDGTIHPFQVAAETRFDDDGTVTGVTLGDALGTGIGDLSPSYDDATPSTIASLRNPETGEVVSNQAEAREGVWSVFGDAEGVGDDTVDWQDVVLRPGDVVSVYYSKDTDSDLLPDDYETQVGTDPEVPDTDGDGLDDREETQVGWTVPFARDGKPQYKVLSSPLSCDADGDGSPDGPGAGNDLYGECPTGQGPESERLTDPTVADTNGDTRLDGDQPLPDALRAIPVGGRLPVLVRSWGGEGEFGEAKPVGIAVDRNQPLFDSEGKAVPVDSYVLGRMPAPFDDEIITFEGNPRGATPARLTGDMEPSDGDFPGNPNLVAAATGIAVLPGTVGTGDQAGSPIAVNYYAKTPDSDPLNTTAAYTTFNSTTGEDLMGSTGEPARVTGQYGGYCECFFPPIFDQGTGESTIGHGPLDFATPSSIVIGHGRANQARDNNANADPRSIPTLYRTGDPEANIWTTYGEKPPNTSEDLIPGTIVDASGIAVDRGNGRLYVADDISTAPDELRGTLTRFNLATREVEHFAGTSDGSLAGLRGLAVDPNGQYIYATSDHCNAVYKLSPSLSILGAIGGPVCQASPGPSDLETPSDVDVDAANGLWVTDAEQQLISFYFYPFGP